ncbi:unnamed protein product [Arabidopsis halleri]
MYTETPFVHVSSTLMKIPSLFHIDSQLLIIIHISESIHSPQHSSSSCSSRFNQEIFNQILKQPLLIPSPVAIHIVIKEF